MANYQNQYAAPPQIVDPSHPLSLSQADEAPQHFVGDDQGKTEVKGLKEKIKEKLPGQHKDKPSALTAASSGEEHLHEKKGIMGKVKEKLPGLHH